jgi:hypothetical protein
MGKGECLATPFKNDLGILPRCGAGWQWRWFGGGGLWLLKRSVDQLLKTPPHTFAQLMRNPDQTVAPGVRCPKFPP